jgi:hypothetical protein
VALSGWLHRRHPASTMLSFARAPGIESTDALALLNGLLISLGWMASLESRYLPAGYTHGSASLPTF